MDITAAHAARAYGAARPLTAPDAGRDAGLAAQGGSGAAFAQSFAETMTRAEGAARETMLESADPHALVAALSEAQLAVETVVAVRDRVVEAYLEILRMPV